MPLRPYQKKIFDDIPITLRDNGNNGVLVQAPARSGKSHIISSTTQRIINANKGLIPVVLTHRGKIHKQLINHCSGISIDADTEYIFIQPGHCYVAMHQSLIKRQSIISQLIAAGNKVILIIDECHRGDFVKMFELLPQATRIGFSATPAWKWAKHLPKWYASLIHGPQPQELIKMGNITPIDYYEMRNDLSTLSKGSTGDFTEASQQLTFDKAQLYDGLFIELASFKFNKCIVFCASKKSADLINDQFITNGYRAVKYYSGLKNGSYELAKFTELDQANVLVTVSALSEGFDYTKIDFNILWRATTSLPLFIQMAMRGATPDPCKTITTVLDFGGNNSRFGGKKNINALIMDRDWHALSQQPPVLPKTSNGVAAIKNCVACDFIISALARSCSNCGYIYPEAEVKLKEGELIKIEHDLAAVKDQAAALMGRRISSLTAPELALYAKEKDRKKICMRVAKSKAITDNQFIADYGKSMGYKSGWADRELRNIAEILQEQPEYKIEYFDMIVK